MSYILNIETSTKQCSVSVAENGNLTAVVEIAEEQFSHAEKLHIFIEEVVLKSNISLHQLSAIAVSQGPGSYTGLRIGVSAAKGLCYALEIPLIAVSTLEVLARQLPVSTGFIVPMIDARRMEVFTQIFDAEYNAVTDARALIIDEHSFSEYEKELHFLGDGAEKCQKILTGKNHIFHLDHTYPSSKEMAGISYEKYKKSDIADVAYFEPYYLKDFQLNK